MEPDENVAVVTPATWEWGWDAERGEFANSAPVKVSFAVTTRGIDMTLTGVDGVIRLGFHFASVVRMLAAATAKPKQPSLKNL